ncbi:general stress protein [Deinococcus sp. RL]|uniref:pyridoxamine 5'-phosphate oxidase family protein n=1 Tax=Deinococcus sp. RL TaxID=1489678 RepID=UPI0004D71208|nr:pyridoxamine 5'-phosphate oxidase family protein [Deinococcus sp. RL]KEF34646.1 general stress protein [Deinococcus sp. RL]
MSQNQEHPTREETIKAMAAVMKNVKFAMLTVQAEDGHLQAHPMTTQQTEFDGDVWFIGGKDTAQVQSMRVRPNVNVSYADHSGGNYVSISGAAQLVEDRAKLEELWSDFYKAYFPGGMDDPNVQLIKIEAQGGEYWGSDGKLKNFLQMARAAVTGKPATDLGTNETVEF